MNGCNSPASANAIITVNPIPNAPTAANVSGKAVCDTGSVQLTATCSNGQTPQWYNNNVNVSPASLTTAAGNPSVIFNTPVISATTTFYVGCKDDNTGCETAPKDRRPIVATVIKNVTNGGSIAKSQTSCGPFKPAPFTNVTDASGGSTAPEYIWLSHKMTSPTDTIFTPNDPVNWPIIVGATGSAYAVPTVLTDSYLFIRCSRSSGDFQIINNVSSACGYIGETNVIVIRINPTLSPQITPITPKCVGEPIVLNVSGGIGNTYSWTGSGFTSSQQNPTVSPTPTIPGIYTYSVSVSGTGGCTGTATTSVTVKAIPTVSVASISICEGSTGTLTSTPADSYLWSSSNAGFTGTTQSVSVSKAGTYSVTVTTNGCTATAVATLTVNNRPTGLTATAINATCNGDVSKNDGQVKLTGTFTGLKYDIVEGATYTGIKNYVDATDIPANGIVKSNITNPSTLAGTKYTVRIFNANNCYTDYTVTIQQVICSCGEAKCVSYSVIKTKSGTK